MEFKYIDKRHFGLDMLRILSMLMILCLHVVNFGHVKNYFDITDLNFWIVNIFYNLSLVAVNCYVLISGFFLVNSEFKLSKIVRLWGEVIFWTVSITIALQIFERDLSVFNILQSFVPFGLNHYWFITVYSALYMAFPFYNVVIRRMNKKQHGFVIFCLVMIFSVWDTVSVFTETLDETGGYSIIWFTVLYFIAAYIKSYDIKIKKRICLAVYLISIMISFTLYLGTNVVTIPYVSEYIKNHLLYSYNNIFNLIASVGLFMLLYQVNTKNKHLKSLICGVAPLTLGVYIIHTHFLLKRYIWNSQIVLGMQDSSCFIGYFLAIVFGIFIACIALEKVRAALTKKLGISKACVKICDNIEARVTQFLS